MTLRRASLLPVVPAVLSASMFWACASADETAPVEPGPISIPTIVDGDWSLTVAYQGDVRINGVACGELEVQSPGDEIVSVDRLGRLRMFRRSADGFEEIEVGPISAVGDGLEFQGTMNAPSGELVQVVCADLVPRIPGDEIVAVGMLEGGEDDGGKGLVRVFARAGIDRAWVEYRHVTPGLVHAVTAGDIAPQLPGNEFLVAGFFGEARIGRLELVRGRPLLAVGVEGGTMPHEGNAKGACLTEQGFVLACDDGHTVEYRRGDDLSWTMHDRVDLGAPLARIAAFPPTGAVAVCANDGTFRILRRDVEGGIKDELFMVRADNRLRGAVVADLDVAHPGLETATAGYDGEIRLIRFTPALDASSVDGEVASSAKTLATDTAKIHHLTTGSFSGMGLCLVSCGYSGDILVVGRADSDG